MLECDGLRWRPSSEWTLAAGARVRNPRSLKPGNHNMGAASAAGPADRGCPLSKRDQVRP